MASRYVAVCGGANLDVGGIPAAVPVMRDSNPGRVMTTAGGVGRNIAAGIAALGERVTMLTALGDDRSGETVRALSPGVDFSHALILPERATSTYLYLTDETGDMLLAVNDMAVTDELTPAYFAEHLDVLNSAAAVVLDANLPADALAYLCANVTVPLFADPVSTVKGMKLLPLLGSLFALKPNRLEAEALTGCSSPEDAARALLDKGVKQVFLSMGGDGVLCGSERGLYHIPTPPTSIHNTTGAGDAFTAAVTVAHLRGLDAEAATRFAMDCVIQKLRLEASL